MTKPVPGKKLSELQYENVNAKNAAEKTMSIKDWIQNMKTEDMVRVFDRGIDGSVGGLDPTWRHCTIRTARCLSLSSETSRTKRRLRLSNTWRMSIKRFKGFTISTRMHQPVEASVVF